MHQSDGEHKTTARLLELLASEKEAGYNSWFTDFPFWLSDLHQGSTYIIVQGRNTIHDWYALHRLRPPALAQFIAVNIMVRWPNHFISIQQKVLYLMYKLSVPALEKEHRVLQYVENAELPSELYALRDSMLCITTTDGKLNESQKFNDTNIFLFLNQLAVTISIWLTILIRNVRKKTRLEEPGFEQKWLTKLCNQCRQAMTASPLMQICATIVL